MSQKDSLSLNKLKHFFRMDKNSSGSNRDKTDADLLRELELLLQPQVPIAQRCKTLKDLCDSDKIIRLEDASIQKLWELTKDLVVPNKPIEQRHIAYRFYQKLIQSQYEDLSLMREHFFRVVQSHDVAEDIQNRLDLLKTLTDNGKNIKNVDDEIGEFILKWLSTINDTYLIEQILEVVTNIIVYNAAYLDPKIVVGIITYACYMCSSLDDVKTVLQCLRVLDAALCYTVFPLETLSSCIGALCRTVNKETYCQTSWDIMKKLLGTNMGHAALLTMCNILNNSTTYDEALLRGAVFYINMGLWGTTGSKVSMFKCAPSSVLLSFLCALKSQRIIVTYEVILGIQRLINLSGPQLSEPSWDVLCDILKAIADNISYYEKMNELPRDGVIQNAYHETLNNIEQLLQRNEAATNPDTIYSVIEYVCEERSEHSMIQLIEYKATKISPTQSQWLQELHDFMRRFYNMQNVNIRNKSLQVINRVMDTNRAAYEEEILESIVIPIFSNIFHENDTNIRTNVGKLLLNFVAYCDTKRSIELLDIIEKLLNRPFDKFTEESKIILKNDDELLHIAAIVDELIRVFILKLYTLPSSHAIKIFTILNTHLEKYYQKPILLESSVLIRNKIFAWMLKMRANATYHIGYPNDAKGGRIHFSHFLSIDINELNFRQQQQSANVPITQQQQQQQQSPPTLTQQISQESEAQSTISVRRSCKIIIECLMSEKDWSVMQLVLKGLPLLLQNKALLRGVDMEKLANTISELAKTNASKPRIDTFISTTPKPLLSDYQSLIYSAIAALIPYHQSLSTRTQTRMITSLRPGLLSLDPHVCVHAFTVMLLEMLEMMLRHLPDILLEMSRMSTTLNVAVPVLEFLSTLSRVSSRLFANFTQTQYMYVFAISLPYTNPHKYDHYTVSLAHHVIAGWFLKCRLSLRKDFVLYILKGFMTNVQKPFEEVKRVDYVAVNEDSSNRKRSSSLTERGTKNRERPSLQHLSIKRDESADEVAYNFHMELADTCIDFLARHTYSSCSALPKRSPTAEYLLTNCQPMSWLVGHNLITITTSGCSSITVRNGLCDRCSLVCKPTQSLKSCGPSGATSPEINSTKSSGSDLHKRYTKASLQHNSGQDSESSEFTSSNSSSATATPYPLPADQTGRFFRQPSNEGRFSNSSGSLEALSRRGSNPDTSDNAHDSSFLPPFLSPQQSTDRSKQLCACSCTGWAEIVIRRPTGNMSWIMRIQNQIALDSLTSEVPLQDLISMSMPSLGRIYNNFSDLLAEDSPWASNADAFGESIIPEQIKKRSANLDVDDTKTSEKGPKKEENQQNQTGNSTQIPDIPITTISMESIPSMSTTAQLSGPINIPKSTQKDKIPSGSFSDVELDAEDEDANVAFDENESRSRNPVRRVNSSPEMSSNWRHPFMNQKPGQVASNNGTNPLIHASNDDDDVNVMDVEQQQKKKNYGKVSCEAIPEEIADSTPPSHNQIETKHSSKEDLPTPVVASGAAKNHHVDFINKSNAAHNTCVSLPASRGSSIISSSDTLAPFNQNTAMPRKQHSADEALQQQQQHPHKNEQMHSLSGPSINLGGGGGSNHKVKLSIDMPKLATKPPQSHAPLSPRLLARNSGDPSYLGGLSNLNELPRGRSKTISVVRREHDNRDTNWTYKGTRSGISPSSIFLQLFNTGPNKVAERPIQINHKNSKAIDLLDLIPPFEVHKIGVLYVGRGQANSETEILRNRYGSLRYMEFVQNLGVLVSLKHARDLNLFVDMETDGRDGNFTYIWQDDIIQVTFHIATLMPNKDHDPNCNEKKKNIGNDFVSIVYNESGEEYNLNTIKGQFNYACVIVQPLELNSNRIFVRCKDDVAKFICHTDPKIISDSNAPRYARQLALHANLASLVAQSLKTKNSSPYASNWLERLRRIKHLRAKIMKETGPTVTAPSTTSGTATNTNSNDRETEDFTQYT